MIVEPGFLDHWKTKLLRRLLKKEYVERYVLRLWEYCQLRRCDALPADPDAIAAICTYKGDATLFLDAMKRTFIEESADGTLRPHSWAETNAALVTAWSNAKYGKLGGRPRNPPGNHAATRTKPEKRRVEKRRKEQNRKEKSGGNIAHHPPTFDEVCAYMTHLGVVNAGREAERFVAHHAQRGWMLKGGLPMKDWKHAAVTWKGNIAVFTANQNTHGNAPASTPHDAGYFDDWNTQGAAHAGGSQSCGGNLQ